MKGGEKKRKKQIRKRKKVWYEISDLTDEKVEGSCDNRERMTVCVKERKKESERERERIFNHKYMLCLFMFLFVFFLF